MATALDSVVPDVVISYAPRDLQVATRLREILTDWFDNRVWIRDFNLQGGQLVAEALSDAIGESRWFVLILSAAAMDSGWVRAEANLATFRAIREEEFRLVVVRLEQVAIPRIIRDATRDHRVFDLPSDDVMDDVLLQIAEYIQSTPSTQGPKGALFVDRGEDADRFSLTARKNRIILVVGWPGIGKSAFATHAVPERLRKKGLRVRLSRGHTLDLLCRHVIHAAKVPQPAPDASDSDLLLAALAALERRVDHFFLVLDNLEDAIDANTRVSTFLETFFLEFIRSGIRTHVVCTTTIHAEYPPAIASETDVLRLEPLAERYIQDALEQWLEEHPHHDEIVRSPQFSNLVSLAAGYPLAAKLLASYLKAGKQPQQLLAVPERRRFELKLAAHLLRAADEEISALERLILHILSTVQEPMAVADMLSITELSQHLVTEVHDALWSLSNQFLVEYTGELIGVHRFIGAYYRDQLARATESGPWGNRRTDIARDYGGYAFRRAKQLHNDVTSVLARGEQPPEGLVAQASGGVLRYAVPAARLLRSVGRDDLADELPLHIRGSVREMVFHYYQERRDYEQALAYANRWLELAPNDLEVRLYQVRCYRNLGGQTAISRAEELIRELEALSYSSYLRQRLCREKALLSEARGDLDAAERFYREGIGHGGLRYGNNHIGLAQLLLRRADEGSGEAAAGAVQEAVQLLRQARSAAARFDELHLGTFVDALARAGLDEEAFGILYEALRERPGDARLEYRLAEILRRREQFEEAEVHARRAMKGATKAPLTLANVLASRAIRDQEAGDTGSAAARLSEALAVLEVFRPEFGRDVEVGAGIRAKVLRLLGRPSEARDLLSGHEGTTNVFLAYEQSRSDMHYADELAGDGKSEAAQGVIRTAIERLEALESRQVLSDQLRSALADLRERERFFRS
jgi:tetratricopeptide (TPR) repeat protein